MNELKNLIRKYHTEWTKRGKWKRPNLADAVAFTGDEVDELKQAYDGGVDLLADIAPEAFDVFMMCHVSADISGTPLEIVNLDSMNPGVIVKKMVEKFFLVNRARLRLVQDYTRNNPQAADWDEFGAQLSSLASLAIAFVVSVGLDFETVAKNKLGKMEAKRK